MTERRHEKRVSVGLFVREIVGESSYASFVTNLSVGGLLLERPPGAAPPASPVQLEIRLPDHGGHADPDPVWGLAQVVYDEGAESAESDECGGPGRRRSALRFSVMASAHRERLSSWLAQQRGGESWEDLGHGVRVLRPS